MFRMLLIPAFLATVLMVLTSVPAHAYGAAHVGYTTVSPTGNVQHYGAKPGKRGNFEVANLPGVEMIFSKSVMATAPTKGRVLDHIGVEVANLEAFSKKMQAEGVKFDREYRKQDIFGIVVLADPWGTAMELTEGQRLY